LTVQLEYDNYGVTQLIYEPDPASNKEPNANVAGLTLSSFQTEVTEHTYWANHFHVTFSVSQLTDPLHLHLSKPSLPISVITAISM
jgi:hypothetical protein